MSKKRSGLKVTGNGNLVTMSPESRAVISDTDGVKVEHRGCFLWLRRSDNGLVLEGAHGCQFTLEARGFSQFLLKFKKRS